MKLFLTTTLLFLPFIAFGQEFSYKIKGIVNKQDGVKYAYLTTLSHQTTISSGKIFSMVPIIDGKFEFDGTFDLEGKKYQNACVFIDQRNNITKDEVISKFKQLVWVVGRDNNLKPIILEDITIEVNQSNNMSLSAILDKGTLTLQYYQSIEASNSGDKTLVDFIKKYPDSPISFNAVIEVNEMIDITDKERLEAIWGTREELFMALSENLRNSKEGIALRKKIDDKFKKQK